MPGFYERCLEVSRATVSRIRLRHGAGVAGAAIERLRPGRPSVFGGEVRARLTPLGYNTPPAGCARRNLRLLVETAVKLGYVETVWVG